MRDIWYDVEVTDEENEKLWEALGLLTKQKINNQVGFYQVPMWSGKGYSFFSMVKGNKIEITGIFEQTFGKIYKKSTILFDY